MERFAFYERARKVTLHPPSRAFPLRVSLSGCQAFCVVATGEKRLYGEALPVAGIVAVCQPPPSAQRTQQTAQATSSSRRV